MSKYGHRPVNWFEAIVNKMGGEEVAEAYLRGEYALQKVVQSVVTVLSFISASVIPALVKSFSVKAHFKQNLTAKVKVSYVDPDIHTWLSATVTPRYGYDLKCFELTKNANDTAVTKGLGENYKVDMAAIWAMMSEQPNGEAGNLLNNGYANIFYVEGCVVDVRWSGGGWSVYVSRFGGDGDWGAGSRVFSRNS